MQRNRFKRKYGNTTHLESEEMRVVCLWCKRADGSSEVVYVVLVVTNKRPPSGPLSERERSIYDNLRTLFGPDGPTARQIISESSPSGSEPTVQVVVVCQNYIKNAWRKANTKLKEGLSSRPT